MYMDLKDLLKILYPLHRTLASDGTDEALNIIGEHMPGLSNYSIETYMPGSKVWTWTVPERYVVHDAYLETETLGMNSNPIFILM
jgi:aminopeptidase-like protein